MTKLATLRITVPTDDAVRVEDVVASLRALLRGKETEAIQRPARDGQQDIEKEVGAVFWAAADVKRGPATKAERAQNEGAL